MIDCATPLTPALSPLFPPNSLEGEVWGEGVRAVFPIWEKNGSA